MVALADTLLSTDIPATHQWTVWGLSLKVQLELARDQWLKDCTPPEPDRLEEIVQSFLEIQGITTQSELRSWMTQELVSKADLEARAIRQHHWLSVCEDRCGAKLASYFLECKSRLDQVSYSLCEVADEDLAHEIYLRLKEGEVSFDQLIQQPLAGVKAQQRGPVALADLPESLAQVLRVSRPQQLWSPRSGSGGWVIVCLKELMPAVLDRPLRRKLLLELGDRLLSESRQGISLPAAARPALQ